MKKHLKQIVIGAFLTVGLGLTFSFVTLNINEGNREMEDDSACKYGQCYATASSTGQRCRRCTAEFRNYCSSHGGVSY